ncbi:MAG TPA: hypothetical protein ENF51_01235 [Candidatus Aenigmarchaeota archaeon]|nr:hypothetical protein [Candidatus Aenigmarchaeota archaeon]
METSSKLWALVAYLFGVVGFILVYLAKRRDAFAVYHAKQSLLLSVAAVALMLVMAIPSIGWVIAGLGFVLLLVLWFIGVYYALTGQQKPIPILGKYAEQL